MTRQYRTARDGSWYSSFKPVYDSTAQVGAAARLRWLGPLWCASSMLSYCYYCIVILAGWVLCGVLVGAQSGRQASVCSYLYYLLFYCYIILLYCYFYIVILLLPVLYCYIGIMAQSGRSFSGGAQPSSDQRPAEGISGWLVSREHTG